MAATRTIRIPLRDSVGRKQVDALAYRSDWTFDDVIEATEDRPLEVIWKTADRKAAVHYVEDHLLQLGYVVVRGADPEPAAELVRKKLKTYTRDDALALHAGAGDDAAMIDALYVAAVLATPEEDPGLRAVLEAGFASSSSEVRRAAVFAVAYAEWPGLRAPLERLAKDDPDPVVREDAAAMLEGLGKKSKGGLE